MDPRGKTLLWWVLLDSIGVALILVAVLALNDGPRTILGIFSNANQVYLAAAGVAIMAVGLVVLAVGLLRRQ